MLKIHRLILLLLIPISFNTIAYSKSTAYPSKTELNKVIQACNQTFQSGTAEEIKKNFPLNDLQDFLASIRKSKITCKAGQSRIIKINRDSALVLLTGNLLYGNSGGETISSAMYSGVYIFKVLSSKWTMTGKLEADRKNQLKSHKITAFVDPVGGTLSVADTLVINTKESYGFVIVLNHRAKITSLQLNHKDIPYQFDGGILWAGSPAGSKQKLSLSYTITVDTLQKDKNSGYFNTTYGHVRNQFFWHPFFGFSSENDLANFSVHISIPSIYHLSTSLPQTDTIIGSNRIIKAQTPYPTYALGLYYDKDWKLRQYKKSDYQLEIFSTSDFKPLPDSVYNAFSSAFNLLSDKFGKPQGKYLTIVQDRSNPGSGWLNRSNDMIVAASNGSTMLSGGAFPRAPFAHEVAHAWTSPTGPAANFLREGWASFAESYFLAKKYGDTIFPKYLQNYRDFYFKGDNDMNNSLWDDVSNEGVSYYKGVWVLYMLQKQLGKPAFEKGLKDFMQSAEPMTIELFIQKLSAAAGKDIHPMINPWLKSKQVPHIKYILQADELVVNQEGDLFNFPLDVQFTLNNGIKIPATFNISLQHQSFKLPNLKSTDIASTLLDPDHKILMKIITEK